MSLRRDSEAQRYAQKRREAALKLQKAARSKKLGMARNDHETSFNMDFSHQPSTQEQIQDDHEDEEERTTHHRFQLQLPEWMVDVPQHLSRDWLVMPRPEGKRCLLETSSRGQVVTRGRGGFIIHSLKSTLPASCCIDCIFHEQEKTFYALDLISWNGHEFLGCDATFRLSWLKSKMEEEAQTSASSRPVVPARDESMTSDALGDRAVLSLTDPATSEEFRLIQLAFFPADAQGLTSCYSQSTIHDAARQHCSFGFIPDGLSFIHCESHYSLGGQSPLFILWKDSQCSRYLLDTDSKGVPLEKQQLTLQLLMDSTVATGDEPPVVLGQLPPGFIDQIASAGPSSVKLTAGRLLRFSLGQGGIQFHDSRPYGADLTFLGVVSQRRSKADPFTKILFQHHARHNPITFDQIISNLNEAEINCSMDQEV